MYRNPMFVVDDEEAMMEFVRNYPLATIVGLKADGYPVATHTPVLLERKGERIVAYGHVERAEEHTLAVEHHAKVLLVFQGPNAYISASWYQNPNTASTWNYAAVHAEGELHFVDDKALVGILKKSSETFECNASPAAYHRLPQEYLASHLPAIAGFMVVVEKWQYVAKLSQNRDRASYLAIIDQLMTGSGMEQDLGLMMYRLIK